MEGSKVSNVLDRSMYMFIETLLKSSCFIRRSTYCMATSSVE